MKLMQSIFSTGLVLSMSMLAGMASASDKQAFEVTVTNITKGEVFTPIMVASHRHGVKLFEIGEPVDQDLEILAESGDTQPLSTSLLTSGLALDVITADGPLFPGRSVTLTVKTNKRNTHVSVASMLVPTNDAFFAVNGIHGPVAKNQKQFILPPTMQVPKPMMSFALTSPVLRLPVLAKALTLNRVKVMSTSTRVYRAMAI